MYFCYLWTSWKKERLLSWLQNDCSVVQACPRLVCVLLQAFLWSRWLMALFAVQGAHVTAGLSKAEQDMDLCKTWDARILQTCEFLMTLKSRKNSRNWSSQVYYLKIEFGLPVTLILLFCCTVGISQDRIKGYFTADETSGNNIHVLLVEVRNCVMKSQTRANTLP